MMTRTMIVLGSGLLLSGGALTMTRALFPRALPLADAFDALHGPPAAAGTANRLTMPGDDEDGETTRGAELERRGGEFARRLFAGLGYDFAARSADLRIVHRDPNQLAFAQLAALVAGAATPILGGISLAMSGVSIGSIWLLVGAVLGAVAGFVMPDRFLRERAAEARVDFVAAFTAYLELVRTLIAGGMNVQGALHVAALAGEGPAFEELVIAIDRAATAGTTIAIEFDRLGDQAGLPEVSQLASSLDLAAEQGASPGEALSSRAETLTNRRAYEEREAAEQATAQMSIPTAVLALGYVLLLGAPAVAAVLASTASAALP